MGKSDAKNYVARYKFFAEDIRYFDDNLDEFDATNHIHTEKNLAAIILRQKNMKLFGDFPELADF